MRYAMILFLLALSACNPAAAYVADVECAGLAGDVGRCPTDFPEGFQGDGVWVGACGAVEWCPDGVADVRFDAWPRPSCAGGVPSCEDGREPVCVLVPVGDVGGGGPGDYPCP